MKYDNPSYNLQEEYVYSDSVYFMDMSSALLLLQWYRNRGGLQCEIDAYGDFLQALGPEGTIDYCKITKVSYRNVLALHS